MNSNKRSIAVDLKDPKAVARLADSSRPATCSSRISAPG